MADSTIGSLPAASALNDSSLLVVEQSGAAMNLTGLLLKQYVQNAVQPQVDAAKASADAAAGSATTASNSATAAAASKKAAALSETAAEDAQAAAENAKADAIAAKTAAITAKNDAVAAKNDAVAAKEAAALSANAAATSASNAGLSEDNAADSATAAAASEANALSYKNAAATSENNAATAAMNAAESANAALISEINASTSETNAGASATTASTAATAAESSAEKAAESQTAAETARAAAEAAAEAAAYAFIFPEDHGAKGDGVTDDADAIQNCIADAETTKKAIYFPGGKVYKCSKTLTINTPIQMTGATTNSATILSEAGTALEIICNLESVATTLNLSIDNLIFKSATWTNSTAPTIDNIAIKFNDSWLMYMQLKNLQFFGYNKCFYFYGTAKNRPYAHNILISHINTWDCNCIIDQYNTSDGGSFVYGGDIEFIQFENFHKPFNTPYVIKLNLWQNLNLRNLIIEGAAEAAYVGVVYVNRNTFECDNFYLEMLGTAVSNAIFVQETSNTYGGIKVTNIYGVSTGNAAWANTTLPATLQFIYPVAAPVQVLTNKTSYNIIESLNCGSYWSGSSDDDWLPGDNVYKLKNNGAVTILFNSSNKCIEYKGENTEMITKNGVELTPLTANAKLYEGMGWKPASSGNLTMQFKLAGSYGILMTEHSGKMSFTGGSTRVGSNTYIGSARSRKFYYYMSGGSPFTATFAVDASTVIYRIAFYPNATDKKGEC